MREKYVSPDGQDQVMLEDESGRLRLIGTALEHSLLVTGCIIAVMGTENANGDFEVVDMKVPDLPRQPQRWERDDINQSTASGDKDGKRPSREEGGKVAIVSGLGISGDEADSLTLDLLMEYLLGEATAPSTQAEAGVISRLIVAGNSLADTVSLPLPDEATTSTKKASKKYGYDSSAYNPAPTTHLDTFLATLLPTIPITLIPGATDPANASMPQQPIHSAMFPHSRVYAAATPEDSGWFDSVTNPWVGDVQGWRMLGIGGQPVDDIFKYVEGDDRLEIMERMLRWRCCAPTAPDTLCMLFLFFSSPLPNREWHADIGYWPGCYPFQDRDPFVLDECPHVFFAGNQPHFDTAVIDGPAGQQVRLLTIPKFRETGQVVLLDLETLDVEMLHFEVANAGD